MADWLRRAGRGIASDGSFVTWSVAEGRRGRRWREVVVAGEGIRSSLLLELDPDGRFSHLELSTAAGLLTLHPEGDGTLHGNAITSQRIEHVRGLPWDRDRAIWVEGSTVAVAAGRRADGSDAKSWLAIPRSLLVTGDEPDRPIDWSCVGDDGLPVLGEGSSWPLDEDT